MTQWLYCLGRVEWVKTNIFFELDLKLLFTFTQTSVYILSNFNVCINFSKDVFPQNKIRQNRFCFSQDLTSKHSSSLFPKAERFNEAFSNLKNQLPLSIHIKKYFEFFQTPKITLSGISVISDSDGINREKYDTNREG